MAVRGGPFSRSGHSPLLPPPPFSVTAPPIAFHDHTPHARLSRPRPPFARPVPASTTRTALITSRHRRHTCSSSATHLHLPSLCESLVPASHATFSVARRIHGPRWYHEWCGPEEDGDRGQERAGAPAIMRVACGVQACAIGHSCSGAPSMRSLIVAGDRGRCQGRREQGAGRLC